ncbi:MAG: WG repeat-containing protein [Paludibacteraceae bacterium]|nr:WG repeat-containing protein [Paludibacteraceae bacterium]
MKQQHFFKQLAVALLLTCAIGAQARQTSYETDPRYIYPEGGVLTPMQQCHYYNSDEQYTNNHQYYICKVNGKVGVVDDNKRVLIPMEYDEIRKFDNYYLIRKANNWGLITSYGRFILPPFLKNIQINSVYRKFILTDHKGDTIQAEEAWNPQSRLRKAATIFSAENNFGDFFLLRADSTTKRITLNKYWTSGLFHDGLMPVWDKNSNKLGYLNTKGEWAIPLSIPNNMQTPQEDFAFSGGYMVHSRDGQYKVYDKSGRVQWALNFQKDKYTRNDISPYMEGGFALMSSYSGSKYSGEGKEQWKYVSPTGKELFPEVYGGRIFTARVMYAGELVHPMSEDMVAFPDCSTTKPLWGFFDKNGKVIVRAKYANVHDFHEGLAAVQMPANAENANRWGFIDKTGQMVIPAMFAVEPSDFSEGLAVVKKSNGLKVYINRNAEVVSREYSNAFPFARGTAFVEYYNGYYSDFCAIDHAFTRVNALVPFPISIIRERVIEAANHPESSAGEIYIAENQLFNSRGECFYVWSDIPMYFQSVSEGIVHVKYGNDQHLIDLFCDKTGKIIFYFVPSEF